MPKSPVIVCDTSILIRLRKGKAISCLKALFERVLIPEAVYEEAHDPATREQIHQENFEVYRVERSVLTTLGRGEQEVITLAVLNNFPTIGIDDKDAISKARQFGLRTLNTSQILIVAKRAGVIPAVKPILDRMRQEGEGIDEEDYLETLQEAGE